MRQLIFKFKDDKGLAFKIKQDDSKNHYQMDRVTNMDINDIMLISGTALNATLHMDIASDIELTQQLPCSEPITMHIQKSRLTIQKILSGEDDRLLVVIGPCSVHDPEATLEYARRLTALAKHHSNDLYVVMRTYFEKPRTTVGWKGYINDPNLDESFDIASGLKKSRQLLLQINALNLATATEFLCPRNALYIADLISWGAIGARTTESQIHRELVSGLPCPIGFKNNVDGNIKVAIDAIHSATCPHIITISKPSGGAQAIKTSGNQFCHIVLRGGQRPNYFPADISAAIDQLSKQRLPGQLMIDCSHGNSQKQHKKQIVVCESLCHQIAQGQKNIAAVMIESFLEAGKQNVNPVNNLIYGKSITDGCIDWQDSQALLNKLSIAVKMRREIYQSAQDEFSVLDALVGNK